jgi:hypothetical protein
MVRISSIALSLSILLSIPCLGMDAQNPQYRILIHRLHELREEIRFSKRMGWSEEAKNGKNKKREIQTTLGFDKSQPTWFKIDSLNGKIRESNEKIDSINKHSEYWDNVPNDFNLENYNPKQLLLDVENDNLKYLEGKKNKYEERLTKEPRRRFDITSLDKGLPKRFRLKNRLKFKQIASPIFSDYITEEFIAKQPAKKYCSSSEEESLGRSVSYSSHSSDSDQDSFVQGLLGSGKKKYVPDYESDSDTVETKTVYDSYILENIPVPLKNKKYFQERHRLDTQKNEIARYRATFGSFGWNNAPEILNIKDKIECLTYTTAVKLVINKNTTNTNGPLVQEGIKNEKEFLNRYYEQNS